MPVPSPALTDDLRHQYQALFHGCVINPNRQSLVAAAVQHLAGNQARYHAVGDPLAIPWFFIGLIHNMEASLNFNCHLHNGDPLTARTVQYPPNRPAAGNPPFTWEQSATDALKLRRLDQVKDWTLPGVLYQLEGYNGWGYRRLSPPVNTPYLWSFSNQYTSGKFVADHKYDANAVSQQCGAAVLLFKMVQAELAQFPAAAASS